MDKTAVPVKLPEPTASAWKAYLLGERGRDELRSTLADALPGKTSRTLNSQLARLLNGDGQEICGWLDPDTPRGRALAGVLGRPARELEIWLLAQLNPVHERVVEAHLESWPVEHREDPVAFKRWLMELSDGGVDIDSINVVRVLAPNLQGLARLPGDAFVALVNEVHVGRRELDWRGLHERLVESRLAGVDARPAVRAVLPTLWRWVLSGDWSTSLTLSQAVELTRVQPLPTAELTARLLSLLAEPDAKTRVSLGAALSGTHYAELKAAGLLLESGGGVALADRLVRVLRASAPFHAQPEHARQLAAHADGQQLLRRAVSLAKNTAPWCQQALISPRSVPLCDAVLEGLALHGSPGPEAEAVWAARLWMAMKAAEVAEGALPLASARLSLSSVTDEGDVLARVPASLALDGEGAWDEDRLARLAPHQVPLDWLVDRSHTRSIHARATAGDESARAWLVEGGHPIPAGSLLRWVEAGLTPSDEALVGLREQLDLAGLTRLAVHHPRVLADATLVDAGFASVMPSSPQSSATPSQFVAAAVDLDRQEVLKSWAAPSASRVDSVLSDALTHHYSVRFPGLERLAGLRGAARRALGQEAEPWEVHHDGIRQLRVVARGVFRLRGSPDREEVEDAEALVATVFGERPGRSVPDALWHIRDDPRTRALFFDDGEDDVWSEPLSPA